MLAPGYAITIEAGTNLLSFSLRGFFDKGMLERFARDRAQAGRLLICGPGKHVTVADVSACEILSKEGFDLFGGPLHRPDRAVAVALIVERPLARMQVARMMHGHDDVMVFASGGEAASWLEAHPGVRRGTMQRGHRWTGGSLADT